MLTGFNGAIFSIGQREDLVDPLSDKEDITAAAQNQCVGITQPLVTDNGLCQCVGGRVNAQKSSGIHRKIHGVFQGGIGQPFETRGRVGPITGGFHGA
jgi:hypothetical protein